MQYRCLLLRISTVVAADVYQIVQNMFVSVQYEPRNLGNAYADQNRTTDMMQVRRTAGLYLTNCNSKDTEDHYHVFQFASYSYTVMLGLLV